MTPEHIEKLRAAVRAELEAQRSYNARIATRYGALERRLDRIGSELYRLGLAAILFRAMIFLVAQAWTESAPPPGFLTLVDVLSLLPVGLAPVFLGLRSQADYALLAAQSRALARELRALLPALSKEPSRTYDQLCNIAETAARIMVGEASDWRLEMKARPLSPT